MNVSSLTQRRLITHTWFVRVFWSHNDKKAKQQDIELTKAAVGQYTYYRLLHLPFLFSAPLSILAYRVLPQTTHHHILLTMLIGFGIGIPLGELTRAIWLRVRNRYDR